MKNQKPSKIENIKNFGKDILFYSFYGISWGVNEIIQDTKYCIGTLAKKKYQKIERGDWNPDAYFTPFKMYLEKIN